MATIAEATLSADDFVLRDTFERCPDLQAEVERVVARGEEDVLPLVWASSDDLDALDAALEDDETTAEVRDLTRVDGQVLYQMKWTSKVEFLLHVLTEEDSTILNAVGERGQWNLRILFPKRDALSRTYDYVEERGISLDVRRVYRLDDNKQGRFGLSDAQYTTLTRALETGYYSIPRETNLESLATELGVSHQALSERLRRGHENLILNTLVTGSDGKDR